MSDKPENAVEEDDLFFSRDEDNEPIAKWVEAPGYGEVKAKPMTWGRVKRMLQGDTEIDDLSTKRVADIIRDYIVEPDLSDITEEDIEERMEPMAPNALVSAVMVVSGLEEEVEEAQEEVVEGN